MLNTYLQRCLFLLNDLKIQINNPAILTSYINLARGQIAAEGEAIRIIGTLDLAGGTRAYPFSSIVLPANQGLGGVVNVRQAWRVIGTGQTLLAPRAFEWMSLYGMNSAVPQQRAPQIWAQFGQGATGSLYFDPLPDQAYTANLDTVCYPSALTSDTTIEALPYYWTDAVMFFACWLAYLGAQQEDRAAAMWQRYMEFKTRARTFANPSVLPHQYDQSADETAMNRAGAAPMEPIRSSPRAS